jgi:hypothetical protein
MNIAATVRSLSEEPPYKGKINFYVIEVDSDAVEQEVKRWPDLGTHGIVGTTSDRQLKIMVPGHNFGEPLVRAKLDELLRITGG